MTAIGRATRAHTQSFARLLGCAVLTLAAHGMLPRWPNPRSRRRPSAAQPAAVTVADGGSDVDESPPALIATSDGKASSLSGVFSWRLKNVSQVFRTANKAESGVYVVGDFNWRLIMFPRGNNRKNAEYTSVFMDAVDADTLPFNWSRSAKFVLRVRNQLRPDDSVAKDSGHAFTRQARDWGFSQFVKVADVLDPAAGFVVDDTLVIECEVEMPKEICWWNYDSKKETGYVGLKNQGATCYMNSLLQTLFHLPLFRQAVYQLPTSDADVPAKSIPLAMQTLFYKLQFDAKSVGTKDLTQSFGWDSYEAFQQHDVQELNRVLCDNLEGKMKGTAVDGTIDKLFKGHMLNYIECVNVVYKSTRKEEFLDLQLDVKDCKDVYASFDNYTEVEPLDGDNMYEAEGHGKQAARKGVLFQDFPPVLQLHLRRFDYDFQCDTMVKINDRYEFPLELDLGRDGGKYLVAGADRSKPCKYLLHSVLVHSGGVHGGHYYAFIRPDCGVKSVTPGGEADAGQWFKFDDERVTREEESEAVDQQFGGDGSPPVTAPTHQPFLSKLAKFSNAYMLVYVREADIASVLCPVTKQDIAQHLHERVKRAAEEKARIKREREEAHLYSLVRFSRVDDMIAQVGRPNSILFDLLDSSKVTPRRVLKATTLVEYREELAKEWGVPADQMRFWTWARRVNKSCRPAKLLEGEEEALTLAGIDDKRNDQNTQALHLFVETPQQGSNALHQRMPSVLLLFFKLYDPIKQEMRLVGHLFCSVKAKLQDYKAAMCAMAGVRADEELHTYEEVKFEPELMLEQMNMHQVLGTGELEDGDIVVFETASSVQQARAARQPHSTAHQYMQYRLQRLPVQFRPLDRPNDDKAAVEVEMERCSTYEELCEAIAREVGAPDGAHIRLTRHNERLGVPHSMPERHENSPTVGEMLGKVSTEQLAMADFGLLRMYYEVLEMPLSELEKMKTLNVDLHNAGGKHLSTHTVHLAPNATARAAVEAVCRAAAREASAPPPRLMRVTFSSTIDKIWEDSEDLGMLYRSDGLRVGEMAPDDLGKAHMIRAYHVEEHSLQGTTAASNFGDPILVGVDEGETLASVKARIRERLGVKEEGFAKWTFHAVTGHTTSRLLTDADTVADKIPPTKDTGYYAPPNYLGMEHANTGPRRPTGVHSRPSTGYTERAIKIAG